MYMQGTPMEIQVQSTDADGTSEDQQYLQRYTFVEPVVKFVTFVKFDCMKTRLESD